MAKRETYVAPELSFVDIAARVLVTVSVVFALVGLFVLGVALGVKL